MGSHVRIARVYEQPARDEGARVLVDRLWPRGIRKDDPRVGRWMPEVAPSAELRRWYSHRPELFDQFAARYTAELAEGAAAEALAELRTMVEAGPLLLVTSTRDIELSQAAVLRNVLSGAGP
ncbi:DUF488 domain-containing protein [Mycolicibacterium phlei]|jgi:uncharacterized protein YeaO (DUF488 family)